MHPSSSKRTSESNIKFEDNDYVFSINSRCMPYYESCNNAIRRINGRISAVPKETHTKMQTGDVKEEATDGEVAVTVQERKPSGLKLEAKDEEMDEDGGDDDQMSFSDRGDDSESEQDHAIGHLEGWLIFQDCPDFRADRFWSLDELNRETADLALKFFGPRNTSKIANIPDLADGGLLIIHIVRLDRQYRGRGLGMRLVVECLKRFVDQWKWAVVWPSIFNDQDTKHMSKQEFDRAQINLRAVRDAKHRSVSLDTQLFGLRQAFERNGFNEVANTGFLLLSVGEFQNRLDRRDFSGAALNVDIRPTPCSCLNGLSPRALLNIGWTAGRRNDDMRMNMMTCEDCFTARGIAKKALLFEISEAGFIPPNITLTKTIVRGFQHAIAVIAELLCNEPPIFPSEENILAYIHVKGPVNYSETSGPASVLRYIKAGGSVLDALDCILFYTKEGCHTFEEDVDNEPHGFKARYDALPRCKEHDGIKPHGTKGRDHEALRARIWNAAGKNAAVRGPYRGPDMRRSSTNEEDATAISHLQFLQTFSP